VEVVATAARRHWEKQAVRKDRHVMRKKMTSDSASAHPRNSWRPAATWPRFLSTCTNYVPQNKLQNSIFCHHADHSADTFQCLRLRLGRMDTMSAVMFDAGV
jgi:hypothetical protein